MLWPCHKCGIKTEFDVKPPVLISGGLINGKPLLCGKCLAREIANVWLEDEMGIRRTVSPRVIRAMRV